MNGLNDSISKNRKNIMEKKYYHLIVPTILILFLVVGTSAFAGEIDTTLEKLDLSGFLRMRAWYTSSIIKVPGKFAPTDTYKSVNYQDMFFRNRLNLKLLPNLEIKTTFDVFSTFGYQNSGFALGKGSTNLITRNVYAVFKPGDSSEISLGLKPFSLPGGYILARDASGFQYNQDLFKKKIKAYCALVKAFDDASDTFGEGSDPTDYADDNIYFVGAQFSLSSSISAESYYVHENDKFISESDGRKAALNWIGLHCKLASGNWLCQLGVISNWGCLKLRDDETENFECRDVDALLFEFLASYRFGNLRCSLVAEGATGDPNNSDDEESFQDIKASHGFSYFVVDNLGGIALRGSGESSWFGLYGAGFKLHYPLFGSISLDLNLLHFETTEELTWEDSTTTYLGDEIDFKAEYVYRETMTLFFQSGVFMPQDAYKALDAVNHAADGVVFEAMMGATINY
ncbi:hypothetical protein ACFL27_18910 [candidate division CSSED10-310 bacterium]|uniref:Alginate export domain-containing protein n=1 Tax=candidate division CSSED10-310 bacterium TaxID=2855610 RepID=A0ABV6Z1F7_UNCC1